MLLQEIIQYKREEDLLKRDEIRSLVDYRLQADYSFEKRELDNGSYQTIRKDSPLMDTLVSTSGEEIGVTTTGYQQLAQTIGIPFSYLMKCDPQLRRQNVDSFLKKQKGERLLRLKSEKLRAVLSPRYAIVNDSHVLKSVQNFLNCGVISDPLIGSKVDDENNFRIQILDRNREVIEGTFAGLMIKNSETGYSSLSVELSVFTKVCSNGLIVPRLSGEGYKRKHIGNINFNDFRRYMSANITMLGDNFSQYQYMFEKAAKTIVDRNKYIKHVESLKELPEEWKQAVIARALDNATQWKFASDWTELAQQYNSTVRFKIEEEAGRFLVKEF